MDFAQKTSPSLLCQDPSRASSVSTAESEAPRTDLSTSLSLLRALGHRLMAAARRRPLALAAATAGEWLEWQDLWVGKLE